jgi:hypothetical protein
MHAVPEEDESHYEDARSDGSSHSRSASFAFGACSMASGYGTEGSTYQPYQIPRRDSLNNEWSFANAASASRKREPKSEVDLFFTCLENLDCDEPGYAKPLVEVQTPRDSPRSLVLASGLTFSKMKTQTSTLAGPPTISLLVSINQNGKDRWKPSRSPLRWMRMRTRMK